jgi:hypothetical protein
LYSTGVPDRVTNKSGSGALLEMYTDYAGDETGEYTHRSYRSWRIPPAAWSTAGPTRRPQLLGRLVALWRRQVRISASAVTSRWSAYRAGLGVGEARVSALPCRVLHGSCSRRCAAKSDLRQAYVSASIRSRDDVPVP